MKTLALLWTLSFYAFAWFGLSIMVYDAAQRGWMFGVLIAWLFGTPLIGVPYFVYREVKQ